MRNVTDLLRERNFALLFAGRCTSFLGNAMAPVALAFAVLHLTDSASALGIVLAARMAPHVVLLAVGGVIADRVPRNLVLVGSNLVAGSSQAVVAVLLISGNAEIWHLVVLEAINGGASAIFYPADTSVVPLTVPAQRLQAANAFLRMGTNMIMILGAAAAGISVAAFNAGWTIAIDAATFFVAAAFLSQMRGIRAAAAAGSSIIADLRDGWSEFTSHRWLWAIVVQFTIVLIGFFGTFMVLGPLVAEREFSGARAWAAILAGQSIGFMAGGFVALRWRPSRPILMGTFSVFLNALPLAAMAMGLPLSLVVGAAVVNGVGVELFNVFWYTALHENVAPEALSRVSAYDALGSVALAPLGLAAAGPVADRIGLDAALWVGVCMVVIPTALVLLVPEVRSLRARRLQVTLAPEGVPVAGET